MLLSICIPTMNRSNYLNIMLDSILTCLGYVNSNDVEICILDDSNDNDSEKVVESFKKKCKASIIYERDYKNIGLENAIFKVIRISNGMYCWVISDDDILDAMAISIVLDDIHSNAYDLMIYDKSLFNENGKIIIENESKLEDNIFNNRFDYNSILSKTFYATTYIPSLVFSRVLWNSGHINDVNFHYFPHMRRIYSALPNSNLQTKICSRSIILMRAYNQDYSWNALTIFWGYLYDVINSLDKYEDNAKYSARNICRIRFEHFLYLKELISNIIHKHGNKKSISYTVYRRIKNNITRIEKLRIIFVLLMPVNFLSKIYNYIDDYDNILPKKNNGFIYNIKYNILKYIITYLTNK